MACPVDERMTKEGYKIEQAMKTTSEDIQDTIYANITGETSEKDLYTAIPRISYMHGENILVNEKNGVTNTTRR